MFGRHYERDEHPRHCIGRSGRGGHAFGRFGGRRGGGEGMPRFGRLIGSRDLQLIALALIAEQPRHGYEIIKVLEEKTSGAYSPSPGMVYPTLTYLEESDLVTAQAEGAKKLYSITEKGRAHLAENRSHVEALMARLVVIGEKFAQMRRRYESENRDDRHSLPPLVRAALENLRDVAARRLDAAPSAETRIVEILARAADELRNN
jgi:DNA-binding PadR family transcriptional regulator